MLYAFIVLYTFIFCFNLTKLIYFPPIYHVNFDGKRSYTHKFPQNIYFLPFLDKLYTPRYKRHPGMMEEMITMYLAVEKYRS